MIEGKKVIAIIPARGGSRGVPQKNIIDVGGKPLIAWTIEAAQNAGLIDRLILSSNDEAIMAVARQWGCDVPFVRPAALADDMSSSADVILHALDQLAESYGYVVLLQPTSPFRIADDINACLTACHENGAPAAVSISVVDKSPAWMYRLVADNVIESVLPLQSDVTRRQDLEEIYALNGAVFVARVEHYRRTSSFLTPGTVGMIMPMERSIDIDTPFDVTVARAYLDSLRNDSH